MFHGSETSGLPFEGETKGPYAPFEAESIERAGLHHAFVGHFHAPAEGRWHTYPGNPQPLTFGESGTRGAVEITVGPHGDVERRWHVVQASPAHDLEVGLDGVESSDDVRDRVLEALTGLRGVVRLRLVGEVPSEVELEPARLRELTHELDAEPEIDARAARVAYDFETLAREHSVRGQFVRDVQASERFEDEDERRRVLITGLRALEGRSDLEVPA